MPWTDAEMAKKGAKRPAVAAAVANRAYKACMARPGGSDKQCAARAIVLGLGVSNRGGTEVTKHA